MGPVSAFCARKAELALPVVDGLPAGFDPAIWAQSKSINNGFPYLIANPPP